MNDFFNQHIILENSFAKLEPLEERHYDLLLPVALQKELWAFTAAKVNEPADFRRYFDQALKEKAAKSSYPFAIYDKKQHQYAGSTRFGNISQENKRMEIGWTWYHPALQRTGLNRQCKFLLLSYGFETLGLNRVELKTSHLNHKSQTAMEKIGAVKEGTLRNHMINEDGTVRSTVYYSFLKEDWAGIKESYFKGYSFE
ncbi:MAG: GNAT family protein [Ferruginibacter sp.]